MMRDRLGMLFLPVVNAAVLTILFVGLQTSLCLVSSSEPASLAVVFYCASDLDRMALRVALAVLVVNAIIHPIVNARSRARPTVTSFLDAIVLGTIASGYLLYIRFYDVSPDELYVFGTDRVDWRYVAIMFLIPMSIVAFVVFIIELVVQQAVRLLALRKGL